MAILLGGALMLALLSGCSSTSNDVPRYDVTGTVFTTAGVPAAGLEVSALDDGGFLAGGGLVQSNGAFTIPDVPPGNYILFVQQTVNGVTVNAYSGDVTVVDRNITVAPMIVPVAADVAALGTPEASALAVFARDANQQLIPALVQVSGVSGIFGPSAPVLVDGIPVGLRNVTVTAGARTYTRVGVPFNLHVITVLNLSPAQASGNYAITGTVRNTLGALLPGVQVNLYRDSTLVASQNSSASGELYFGGLPAGTYAMRATQTVGGIPVDLLGSPFAVVNADVTAPALTLPVAADIAALGTPDPAALVVIARTAANDPVINALVRIDGQATLYGPDDVVVVPDIQPGAHLVTVSSGLLTVTRPAIGFTTGRITAVNVVF